MKIEDKKILKIIAEKYQVEAIHQLLEVLQNNEKFSKKIEMMTDSEYTEYILGI